MNTLMRALVLPGVAVAAGLTVAAGPAAATTGPPGARAESGPAPTEASRVVRHRERIYDYFRSPRTCHRVGRMGVWQGRWEAYRCFPVRGFGRGDWALKVYYGDPGHDHGHGGPGGFDGPGGSGGPRGFDGPRGIGGPRGFDGDRGGPEWTRD